MDRYFIDIDTGTWGRAEDLRIVEVSQDELDALADMTDAERGAFGFEKGTTTDEYR